jgi:hypothetical protein
MDAKKWRIPSPSMADEVGRDRPIVETLTGHRCMRVREHAPARAVALDRSFFRSSVGPNALRLSGVLLWPDTDR